jgi:hypothetical protein
MIITQTHCCATGQASPELNAQIPLFSLFKYDHTQTVRDKTFHPSARNEKSQPPYRNNKFANKPGNFTSFLCFVCGSSTFFRRRAFLFLGWLSLVKRAARAKERKQSLFGRLDDTTATTSFIYAWILFSGGGRGQDIDASSLHDVSSSWQNLQRIELCWSIIARKEEEEEEEEGG